MDIFLRSAIGAIVWTLANVIYFDLRRRDVHGFGRLMAFFAGYPGTMVSLFLVRRGHVPRLDPPPDDEERLLREIRVDRELRAGPEAPPGP